MKIWTSEHVFNHSWETVSQAAWRKYPNPMNPAVVGIDVLERRVQEGRLVTDRLISSKWGIPGWAASLIGSPSVCYGYEQSTVDPAQRQMELKTRNITFGSSISVDERLVYSEHPDDPSKTLLRQEAVVTVQGVPLTDYMENILTSKISANAGKGREAMEWVIGKINQEVHELATATKSAVKTTDELLHSAKHSVDGLAERARQLGHLTDGITEKAKNIHLTSETTANQRQL
ncbi:Protein slowmo [Amphibalanus amphitrite]|uniref:Protein slowmo n=1 Tax=Amphibalanus amphitrite TaxID=1232801 RepID=A0A6A4WRT0_AMPAM|nr:protein slowmo-like [Amphibalanus amphitrite]KAF0304818.1 Protein slowmo [Amphibalanus amphitrite]KAF0308985.1 Protein slowmo [Amphibalanus amphitrite]